MLWLDALGQGSPTFWLLLTTSVPEWDGDRWRRAFETLCRAARRRWPGFEYAALIEFTTGYGPRSGGRRRPHANVFVRGVPVEDREAFLAAIAPVWCERMVASERQQRVDLVDDDRGGMRGLTRYVGMHFLKESQAPPKGWRGQRFRASRGYFTESRAVLRERARESLRAGRRVWKAEQAAWARALEEAAAAGYERGSWQESCYLGFLDDEGFVAEWGEEAHSQICATEGGQSWELVSEIRRVLIDGTSKVTGYRVVRPRSGLGRE